jgi:hypothetical protein
MKHVGEAIREYASNVNPEEKIVVLGTATWEMVANNSCLIQSNAFEVKLDLNFSLGKSSINLTDFERPLIITSNTH